MGNQQTNLNLDKIFSGTLVAGVAKNILIKVILDLKITRQKYIYLIIKNDKSCFILTENKIKKYFGEREIITNYTFTPKTHMRDFEIISDLSSKISRGQGIGVVICRAIGSYIKLIYREKRNVDDPVTVAQCAKWNHDSESRKVLENDLNLGYDVLYIDGDGKDISLCEEKDERDEKETLISFSHLENTRNFIPLNN